MGMLHHEKVRKCPYWDQVATQNGQRRRHTIRVYRERHFAGAKYPH